MADFPYRDGAPPWSRATRQAFFLTSPIRRRNLPLASKCESFIRPPPPPPEPHPEDGKIYSDVHLIATGNCCQLVGGQAGKKCNLLLNVIISKIYLYSSRILKFQILYFCHFVYSHYIKMSKGLAVMDNVANAVRSD